MEAAVPCAPRGLPSHGSRLELAPREYTVIVAVPSMEVLQLMKVLRAILEHGSKDRKRRLICGQELLLRERPQSVRRRRQRNKHNVSLSIVRVVSRVANENLRGTLTLIVTGQ